MTKETALFHRKAALLLINEQNIKITEIVRQDEELQYVKSTDSIAFIRLYRRAYDDFKRKLYNRAIKFINSASRLRDNDLLCAYLLNSIKKLMEKRISVG
jgi:hypothetical protein